jgi:hypothetical protein
LDQPVFKGASIYVCILLFRKKSQYSLPTQVSIAKIFHLSQTPASQLARVPVAGDDVQDGYEVFHAPQPEGKAPWVFRNATESELLNFIKNKCDTLNDNDLEIRQGIKTGLDDVFLIQASLAGKKVVYVSDNSKYIVETELLIPIFRNRDLRRWYSKPINFLIYPYDRDQDMLLPWKTIERDFSGCAAYLNANKGRLAERKSLRGKPWYALIEPRLATLESSASRLFIAEMSLRPLFSKSSEPGAGILGGAGGGSWLLLKSAKYQIDSLMAYLNSIVAEWFLRQVSSLRRGGWMLVEQRNLNNLPIPKFLSESGSFACSELNRLSLKLSGHMQAAVGLVSPQVRREIQLIEDQIDSIVMEAIGLSSIQADYIRNRVMASRNGGKAENDDENEKNLI